MISNRMKFFIYSLIALIFLCLFAYLMYYIFHVRSIPKEYREYFTVDRKEQLEVIKLNENADNFFKLKNCKLFDVNETRLVEKLIQMYFHEKNKEVLIKKKTKENIYKFLQNLYIKMTLNANLNLKPFDNAIVEYLSKGKQVSDQELVELFKKEASKFLFVYNINDLQNVVKNKDAIESHLK
ncbi:hypothetical protein GVAV_001703 [Gurleya vavrai]